MTQMPWRLPENRDAPTEPLGPDGVAALHEGAMRVLEEIGIVFLNDEACDLFREAGCLVDGQVVRIRGHSPSFAAVDQLQASLRKDPRFDDIRVSEIQADAKRGGNTFSLTISLAPAGAST